MNDYLTEIWENYTDLKVNEEAMRQNFEEVGHYGDKYVQKKYSRLRWISDCSDNLAENFDEVKPMTESHSTQNSHGFPHKIF